MIEHAGTCSIFDISDNELLFKSGNGGFVYDDKGKEYYDFILGFGPVILGHNFIGFNDYVIDRMKNGIHFPSYSIYHNELVEKIIKSTSLDVAFFKTSSESITAAIRVATQITNKKGILRCGYIGWHDAQIANTITWHEYLDSPLRNIERFQNGFRGVSQNEKVYNWADLDLGSLEDTLNKESEIGIFIIDAYQIHFMSKEIVKEAISICRAHEIIVIIDETKTSGRVAQMGVSSLYDLNYDMLIMGKALANGAPLSLLVAENEVLKYAKVSRITGTFSKEVLSVWCALATYEIMEQSNGYSIIEEIGIKICATINQAIRRENLESYMKCVPVFNSSMFDLKFASIIIENKTSREYLKKLFVDSGILLLQGHPSFVCLAHSKIDFSAFYNSLCNALFKWKKSLER